MTTLNFNPVINSDYPDPDIIRVGDMYYMASTTMFLMPGGDILRSPDLLHWEIVGHAFKTLGDDEQYTLSNGKHAYARGMWAPSLSYNKGTFYLNFACNERKNSLLYIAKDPAGPWECREMNGFFYDSSLFFDDDDKVYIVHGNTTLRLTELDPATWGPKEGGLERILAVDEKDQPLGYEGSHLYKKNGLYYLFTCHMPKETQGRKTEVCFISDSLTGEFKGKTILNDCMGYRPPLQVAQGGMVDDPDGNLYMFMFQDRGPVGRAPVVFPMRFGEDGYPMPDTEDGRIPLVFNGTKAALSQPRKDNDGRGYVYGDEDFRHESVEALLNDCPWWQFSHNPDPDNYKLFPDKGIFRISTGYTCDNLLQSRNTLTQRSMGPASEGEITIDASSLNIGDYAGLCAYNAHYGGLAVTRTEEGFELVTIEADSTSNNIVDKDFYTRKPNFRTFKKLTDPVIRLGVRADFTCTPDYCEYYYYDGDKKARLPYRHRLFFKLDLFIGVRFAFFIYSTQKAGGSADFSDFKIYIDG